MKLSTGKVAFPIEFDNGDKQAIYFNPNDPDLFIRLNNFEKRVNERVVDLKDFEIDENGEAVNAEVIEQLDNIINVIKEEMDIAFGGDISTVVFKHCSPFAIVGGEYFILQFIKAITPEINKHNIKANTEVAKKMAKHTAKYAKR